ncbi:MAG TPA: tyrosine-type recombinase/integrase [Candidatus Acidoferrum sp.]|nr:tyrosine-type recombinase/integrase [Candidatus Acidoferrum sp.]
MPTAQSRQVQPARSQRGHLRHPVRDSQLCRLRIASAIADYLADVRARRSVQAADRLKQLLSDFRRSCRKRHLRAINRRDLIAYMTALRDRGLADRTIFNRTSTMLTFLRSFGVEGLLSRRDLPRYTQKSVDAYSEAEIAQLLRGGNEKSRVICGFFLGTGCREQEVAYMTWNDVDLEQKIVRVTAKPHWNWKPKDSEERSVPVPEWLVNKLTRLKSRSLNSLLFPNQLGRPEGHFLAKLKSLALRAGLNCGHCVNKRGQSCKDKPVCNRWSLHKFRRTFATMHHESGVSARTLQAWLGHSNLETTLRYLRIADLRSDRIRFQVDRTFAKCVRK